MKVTILCSDSKHPIYPYLLRWCEKHANTHELNLVTTVERLLGGDILFLISCAQIIPKSIRKRYRTSLVIHASDLPSGRGWSPLVWQILEGKSSIAVSLLEVADFVDSGPIWKKLWLQFKGTELYDELNEVLFEAELELMEFAIANMADIVPIKQNESLATWYPRRSPQDSRIDPHKSFADQFNLLRVSDPSRYPAFFEYLGEVYEVLIKKREQS